MGLELRATDRKSDSSEEHIVGFGLFMGFFMGFVDNNENIKKTPPDGLRYAVNTTFLFTLYF